MIITLGGKNSTYKVAGGHDPDNIRKLTLIFKPQAWHAGTVYNKPDSESPDIVIPSTFKGLYYAVDNPGISHASTEPTWALTVGDTTNDFEAGKTSGLTWTAKAYNLLPVNEDVSSVAFTPNNGVTLASSSNTTYSATFTVDAIGTSADARTNGLFNVLVRVTTTTGRRFDINLQFNLAS